MTLPEEGRASVAEVFPGWSLPDRLPALVRVTESPGQARETAARLRGAGAGVVVQEEDQLGGAVTCRAHNTQLLRARCEGCGSPLCADCMLEAGGTSLCSGCHHQRQDRAQWTRTRQLMALLVFVFFIYQVHRLQEEDDGIRASGGTVPVALLHFVDTEHLHHPMVRGLSGLDPDWPGPIFQDVADFFGAERERYTGLPPPAIHLSVRGPWTELPVPPPLPAGEGLLADTWRALAYARFWKRLGDRRGVDRSRFPVQVHVVYSDDDGDLAAGSRASSEAKLAVAFVSLQDPNPSYPALTIAHELAHALGATDKYGPDYHALFPEGFVEPYGGSIYPQRYGELMAVDIPIGPGLEREPVSLDEARIGYRTAAELGWIAHETADSYYEFAISPARRRPPSADRPHQDRGPPLQR